MRDLERFIVLQTVDIRWREHLENMDYMREGIHLRGMAQKDPLVEYRNEGHTMFQALTGAIREEVVTLLFHAEVTPDDGSAQLQQQPSPNGGGNGALSYEHESLAGADAILAAGGGTATSTGGFGGGGGGSSRPRSPRSRRSTRSWRTSAATTPAGAARARSTRSATALAVVVHRAADPA